MSRRGLRAALLAVPVPDELEAQRRAWAVVRAGHAVREPVPRRARGLRLAVALLVLAALVAAAVSPPGRAVGGWMRDRVAGKEEAEPALFRLPAAGRLLVLSERGPWIVRADGSKRLLGAYEGAGFSPRGLFVVVTRARRVVALEPDGDPRWALTRPTPVADARWAPSGFRVAYREGDAVRVVAGDGTEDRLLAEGVAPLPPAWSPDAARNVLAYAGADGRIRVVDVDSRAELWEAEPPERPTALEWSHDGGLLLVVTAGSRHPVYRAGNGRRARFVETPARSEVLDAEFAPESEDVAYAAHDAEAGRSTVVLGEARLQAVEGRLEDLVFSPDGRWLLVGWPEADQLLFLRLPGVRRIVAVDDVRREFDPGGSGRGEFPRLSGWCCPG